MKNPVQKWAQKFLTENDAKPKATASDATPAAQAYDFDAFQRKFAQLLAHRSNVPVGRVNVISLADLKDQLGERWSRMESKVHKTAGRVIDSHVSARDIVAPYSPLEYLVVISNATPEAAQLKCACIALEIYRHFLGQEAVEDVSIRSAVEHDNEGLMFEDVSMSDLRALALSNAEEAAQKLETEAGKLTLQPEDEGFEWPAPPVFSEPESGDGVDANGVPNSIPFDPSALEYIYRPLWDIKSEVMSTYICLPCRVLDHGEIAYRYDVLGTRQSDEGRAWIDAMAAREAVTMLDELLRNKFNMFIGTAIHFETLASARLRPRLLGMFNTIPDAMKRYLTLEIVGVPEGVTSGRMSQIVGYLRPLCRAIFVRVDLGRTTLRSFESIGIQAVGIDIRKDNRSEAKIIADINDFSEKAARQRMLSYCLGIGSTSMAISAAGAGFRFISGTRVGSDQSAPMSVLRYDWRDFYVHHDL